MRHGELVGSFIFKKRHGELDEPSRSLLENSPWARQRGRHFVRLSAACL